MSDDKDIVVDEVSGIDGAEPVQPEPDGYDAWYREQVEQAIRESEAPDAVFFTMEEINEEVAKIRAARLSPPLEKAS